MSRFATAATSEMSYWREGTHQKAATVAADGIHTIAAAKPDKINCITSEFVAPQRVLARQCSRH
jgi:hypothetical protein